MSKDQEKGLDYYLAHPEEVDQSNSKLMADLMAQASKAVGDESKIAAAPTEKGSTGTEDKDSKATADAATAADEKATKDAADKATADAKAEADKVAANAKALADAEQAAEGVATKDGKSVIPFSVLADTRARVNVETEARQRAESDAATARAEAEQVKAQLAAALKDKGVVVEAKEKGNPTLAELDAAIDEVKEEAPWMGKSLHAIRSLVAASEARAAKLEVDIAEQAKSFTASQRANSDAAVAEAVDNNPALVLWHTSNKDVWQQALKFDAQLCEDSEWKGKPVAERLNKVVELVAAVRGNSVLPPGYVPSGAKKEPDPAVDPFKGIDPAKAKEIAAAKLKNAGVAATTLSDIPGGDATATDPMDALEKSSTRQVGEMFMTMSPKQQEAYLAKFS